MCISPPFLYKYFRVRLCKNIVAHFYLSYFAESQKAGEGDEAYIQSSQILQNLFVSYEADVCLP